jgi:hypothetical protein
LATRTVAVLVDAVAVLLDAVAVLLGAVVVFDGAGEAVAAPPPPPQAATARATSGMTAALARKVMGLLRVMSLLGLGDRQSQ